MFNTSDHAVGAAEGLEVLSYILW